MKRDVTDLNAERERRKINPERFWKIRLPGECFWVLDPVPYGGLWRAIVQNNLSEHPYGVGDAILFESEQIIRRGYSTDSQPKIAESANSNCGNGQQ